MAGIRRSSEHQSVLRSNKTTSPNFRIGRMRRGRGFDRLVIESEHFTVHPKSEHFTVHHCAILFEETEGPSSWTQA